MKWLYTSNANWLQLLKAHIQGGWETLKSRFAHKPKEPSKESQDQPSKSPWDIPKPKFVHINTNQMAALIELSIHCAIFKYEKSAMAMALCKKMHLPEPIFIAHKQKMESAAHEFSILTDDAIIDFLLKDLKITRP